MCCEAFNDVGSYDWASSVTRHKRVRSTATRTLAQPCSSHAPPQQLPDDIFRVTRSPAHVEIVVPDSTCRRAAGIGTKACHMRCCSAAPKAGIIARPRADTVRGEVLSSCHCHAFTTCCVTCQPRNAAPETVRRQRCPRPPMTQLGATLGSNHRQAGPAWPRRRILAP